MRPTTRRWCRRGAWSCASVILCLAAGLAAAQDADPPARAARLSDAEGAVSLQPAGVQDWGAATLNRPLTSGDRLWSDQHSRAELDLGTATVRLGSYTGFAFLDLDDGSVQMQLSAGTLIVSVRDILPEERYEIDTPNIALSLQQPGVYRVEVNDQGTATAVAVSEGAAQAAGGGQTVAIGSQQLVTFNGLDTLAWQSATLGAPDDFDEWSAERDREAAQSASMGYVASDVPGTQDLDDNGQWQQTPEYGYVWVPTLVAVDWAPYRYGRWVWITPWGWTWIDDARWGYAPFHYGRWVMWNNHWSWVPAPRHGPAVRVIYAPALVAWVGASQAGTPGFGSHVGWFPLGPRELYVPPYRAGAAYVRNVNATNIPVKQVSTSSVAREDNNIRQQYLNETPRGLTAVPRSTMLTGQRVAGQRVSVSPLALAAASVATAPLLMPTQQSVFGTTPARGGARPPASLMQRTLVVRTAPPPAPVPLERQLPAIEANGGRPPTRGELAQLQHAASLTPVRVVSSGGALLHFPAANEAATTQSLAQRERALQQSALPSAARSSALPAASEARPRPADSESFYAPGESLSTPAPVLRTDRPPSAQQHPPQPYQRAGVTDEPPPAVDRASIPVYHLPPADAQPGHPVAAAHPQPPAPPPVPAPSQVPAAHTASPAPVTHPPAPVPTHEQASREPRDSAPHGDRDSRERVLR